MGSVDRQSWSRMGKQSRLLWANDARHYHGFVHEPPIALADARRPVDEVALTLSPRPPS